MKIIFNDDTNDGNDIIRIILQMINIMITITISNWLSRPKRMFSVFEA